MNIFRRFGKAKGRDNTENGVGEKPPKIYITHLGGHKVDPHELMANKKVQELIHKMAKIRLVEKENLSKTPFQDKPTNKSGRGGA